MWKMRKIVKMKNSLNCWSTHARQCSPEQQQNENLLMFTDTARDMTVFKNTNNLLEKTIVMKMF
jgi:hypothetical protein